MTVFFSHGKIAKAMNIDRQI